MSVQIVKKTLLTSGNSIKNIRSSIGSFTNSLKSANKTHSRAAVSTTRSNRFLKNLIVKDENYFQRRREAVLRKEREDIIEASRVGGVVKYSGKTAGDSTKGFLGRVMDFFGIVMLGWAVKNLPWIIKGGLGLIKNVTGLVNISQGFVQNTQSTLEEIGRTVQTSQTKLKEYSFDDEKQDMEKEQETINNNLNILDTDFAVTFADIFDNEKNGLGQFSEWLKGDGGTPPKTENLDGTEVDNKEGGEDKNKETEGKKGNWFTNIFRKKEEKNEKEIISKDPTKERQKQNENKNKQESEIKQVEKEVKEQDEEEDEFDLDPKIASDKTQPLRKRFENGYVPEKEILFKDKKGKQRSKINPEWVEYQEWINDSGFDMFADGGRPEVGKTSIVGEKGPELFVADKPGTIIPNDKLNSDSFFQKTVTHKGTSKDEVRMRRKDRSRYEKAVEELKEKQNGIIYHDQDEALKEKYIFGPRKARKNNTTPPPAPEIKLIVDGVESNKSLESNIKVQKKPSVAETIKKERVGPTIIIPMPSGGGSTPPTPPVPGPGDAGSQHNSPPVLNMIRILQDLELSYT